ncbi:MAG: hypothetical protein RL030_2258, partial [Pseudomonadota bacterium]
MTDTLPREHLRIRLPALAAGILAFMTGCTDVHGTSKS